MNQHFKLKPRPTLQVAAAVCLALVTTTARPETPATSTDASTNPVVRLPAVIVTAQKTPENLESVPVSVTAVTLSTLQEADIQAVKQASIYAPNVFLNEFGARKLSNPYIRGVGAGPNNPAVTTFIDGVPQFNANSSSIELIDVDQVEFIRGPQGALFGRNTIGGVINVTSRRPTELWHSEVQGSYGNYESGYASARVAGPISRNELGLSLAGGYQTAEGYMLNQTTGNDLGSRQAYFGKGQLVLQASEQFDARLVFFGEHDSDGDYALSDLGGLRQHPYVAAHDYEGSTARDILAPTLLLNYHSEAVDVASISGGVWWKTFDTTDLDYTPYPLATRQNAERQYQFTQEFRVASAKDKPLTLAENFQLGWQSGVFIFDQNYQQEVANDLNPPASQLPFGFRDQSTADLQNIGVGVYGLAKLTAWEKWEFSTGLRYDHEGDQATLGASTTPVLMPSSSQNLSQDFNDVSPQFLLGYHFTPTLMTYGSISRGYMAGGFNPVAPAGQSAYGQEHSWNYELGAKSEWCDGKFMLNADVFYIDWSDLQLNQPYGMTGRYYIQNAGSAASKGVELEVRYRPLAGWDLFGDVGYTDAQFLSGSSANGLGVGGNTLPFAPKWTGNVGTQYSLAVCREAAAYARAEVTVVGSYDYDAANLAGQNAYSLADFRLGVRGGHWFAEGFVRNAFDTAYVPVALAYPGFAPSGYIGENGAPRTYGIRAGLNF